MKLHLALTITFIALIMLAAYTGAQKSEQWLEDTYGEVMVP